jgi:hypothetical protein
MDCWLLMLIPYFGRWPEWFNLFVETCKPNRGVRWRFYTDCGEPANRADNVEFVPLSFAEYKAHIRERLGVAFDPPTPYKLCDVRPCLGHIHERELRDFPFFGYGDIDVVYGNLAAFYTPEVLARSNVLSTHPERLSGHLAVLRNTPKVRRAYERIPDLRTLLEHHEYTGMDEGQFTTVFRGKRRGLRGRLRDWFDPCRRGLHFVEQYSTVLSSRGWHDGTMNYPLRWFWRNGRLTNERDGAREFLYLHFMRWQSGRWLSNPPAPTEAAWTRLDRLVHVDWRQATEGFCISPDGFTPLAQTAGRAA